MPGMAVPAIAFYASPPSGVCSATHQINSHTTYDFELSSARSSTSSPPSTAAAPSSAPPRTMVGGLSCLFSSEMGSHQYHHSRSEELKELSSSFGYSKFSSAPPPKRDQSPVSVFQGPVSTGGSYRSSPPIRIGREKIDVRGTNGLFNGFVRNALGSCVDYDSPSFRVENNDGLADELPFNMEESVSLADGGEMESYAKEFLVEAQFKHKVFCEDFVIKAFYEAERAHRGQMRASGDPYLQHCVETAVLLAMIGANSTVVAAGLLHDTLDDSFLRYDYIYSTFGAGVADLVEGVRESVVIGCV